MSHQSEDQVKHVLGIESWRNLSKDKMMRFAAMMPDMDTEVALKIVEQFPVFKEFAVDTVGAMEESYKSTLKANKHSQDQVHQAFQDVRKTLEGELNKDNLNFEEKKFFIEQIQLTARLQSEKDSENKKFLDGVLAKALAGAGAALALGVVFVGGRMLAEQSDKSEAALDS